jgi:D-3-phosphoglycerate dehydrogenase / 2-oxoglutarate reductase
VAAEVTDVLITDCDMGPADLEREVLATAGLELTHLACRTAADVVEQVNAHRASGLLVQYAPIDRAVFEGCPQLRAVVRYGVGLDNIDLEAAAEHGVAVAGVRNYGTNEVADQATALMLALLRRLPQWSAATQMGGWPARGAIADPLELSTCTLGLFGFGAIARAVAGRAAAFGLRVLAHDPYAPVEAFAVHGVDRVDSQRLWSEATAVSLHTPLTAETAGAVNAEALGRMAPGGFLVNTARAGLVDRDALTAALDDGSLGGAGLDVWWTEPADPDDPLLRHPRVLVTPHVAWISPGAVRRLRIGAAHQLLALLQPTPNEQD